MDDLELLIAALPADLHENWRERAAIMEYLGGLAREEAEREAYELVRRSMRPGCVSRSGRQ